SQNCVLPGGVHVLFALPDGSPASSVPLLLVSAKAWIRLSPGSDAVKQNVAWPALSVVSAPLDGVEKVACAPITLNLTDIPGVGLPEASFTVAVTQCWVPTVLVAAGGLRVSVASAGTPVRSGTNASEVP